MKLSLVLVTTGLWLGACTPNETVAREDAGADVVSADTQGPDASGADSAVAPDVSRADAATPDVQPADAATPDAAVLDASPSDGGVVRCGSVRMPSAHTCAPSGVTSRGECDCVIGMAWDGTRCASVTGCECTSNCQNLYPPGPACAEAHAMCAGDGGVSTDSAVADAGSTFACGERSCARGRDYCSVVIPGIPGAPRSYSCAALPAGCATCDCLVTPVGPPGMCASDAAGNLTVTVAAP